VSNKFKRFTLERIRINGDPIEVMHSKNLEHFLAALPIINGGMAWIELTKEDNSVTRFLQRGDETISNQDGKEVLPLEIALYLSSIEL